MASVLVKPSPYADESCSIRPLREKEPVSRYESALSRAFCWPAVSAGAVSFTVGLGADVGVGAAGWGCGATACGVLVEVPLAAAMTMSRRRGDRKGAPAAQPR
jgi:hypothetical protein